MSSDVVKALVVDVIRRLWDRGLYSNNVWLKRIHDNWFEAWVHWKADQTMKNLDREIERIRKDWKWPDGDGYPGNYSERLDGETPLGGPMQNSHPTLGTFDDLTPEE